MAEKVINIGGRLHDTSKHHTVTGANEILDDDLQKKQSVINAEQQEFNQEQEGINADTYRKNEVYNKEETNNIVSRTPETDVIVIEVPAASQSDIAGWLDANTPSGIDPETGRSVRANKLYRVPGPDNTTYSEWAWDGTKYIMLANKDYGIDDKPYKTSSNVVKSSGIYEAIDDVKSVVSTEEIKQFLNPSSILEGKFFIPNGEIRESGSMTLNIYSVEPNKEYLVNGRFGSAIDARFVAWYDSDNQFIYSETYQGSMSESVTIENVRVVAPPNAAYLYFNTQPSQNFAYIFNVKKDVIKSSALKIYAQEGRYKYIDSSFVITPQTTVEGKFIADGVERANANFSYDVYPITGNTDYLFSGHFGPSVDIFFINWYDNDHNFIYSEVQNNTGQELIITDKQITSPENAAYIYLNKQNGYITEFNFKGTYVTDKNDIIDNINDVKKQMVALSDYVQPVSVVNERFINNYGKETENQLLCYYKYSIEGSKTYSFSGRKTEGFVDYYLINWFDADMNYIKAEYFTNSSENDFIDIKICSPANASYLCINVQTSKSDFYCLKKTGYINIENINKSATFGKGVSDEVVKFSDKTQLMNSSIESGGFYDRNVFVEAANVYVNVYEIEPSTVYVFSAKLTEGYDMPLIAWFDEDNKYITSEPYSGTYGQVDDFVDQPVISPQNAKYLKLNIQNAVQEYFSVCSILLDKQKYDDIYDAVTELDKTPLTVVETISGFFNPDGSIRPFASTEIKVFEVTPGEQYCFSGEFPASINILFVGWFDSNGEIVSYEPYAGSMTDVTRITDQLITAPQGAAYLYLNTYIASNYWDASSAEIVFIKSKDLKSEISQGNKFMKVVIVSNTYDNTSFYVRSKYNSEKDIIVDYYTNNNNLISPKCAYVGINSLEDDEIRTIDNRVSYHDDSTGPIRTFVQYWHLFAQHGYPVPTIANNSGMTSADIDAEWKDQLDRHYHIGKVTDSTIWLLPVIYQDADGHYTRDWHSKRTSTAIETLSYVSGGGSGHVTEQITVSSYSETQLCPIVKSEDRCFVIDGTEINNPGTYYCNLFSVNESQKGYDPATVTIWFGNNEKVDLTGALPMVEFTWSYNFVGVNCCVNTTMKILREAKGTFSGTQQQFFFDNGEYKAMFMIPKAAPQNNVELDKPFNSPNTSSRSYSFYRDATYLKDVNDPVDRQIGFLHNPNNGDYLIGMASGLSLVSGDTVKEKRNINRPYGSVLLSFSPSNTNKFYVYATDSSVFENGYFPVGYFKEINYYVSYFDPAENIGQVYWYKDGSRYVIYAHCQSQQSAVAVNVSKIMEGLKLSVVEKTPNAELLTDNIQNGKFFVNYNSNEANYITLIAE